MNNTTLANMGRDKRRQVINRLWRRLEGRYAPRWAKFNGAALPVADSRVVGDFSPSMDAWAAELADCTIAEIQAGLDALLRDPKFHSMMPAAGEFRALAKPMRIPDYQPVTMTDLERQASTDVGKIHLKAIKELLSGKTWEQVDMPPAERAKVEKHFERMGR